jgi:STE24 endopeptidase
MTRFLFLVPFLAWLARTAYAQDGAPSTAAAVIFLGGYVLLIPTMRLWSRWVARRVDSAHFQRRLRRFNFTMTLARFLVAIWFVYALFGGLNWMEFLQAHLTFFERWPLTLPPAFIATLPAYLAWMGLWWSQYPADRALREQGLLAQLDSDLPIHSPPSFWSYFSVNLRLQILFTVVPIMLILLIRDITYISLWQAGIIERDQSRAEPFILLAASATIFLLAPIILATILHTQPLPDSILRRKLEEICRRTRLRYRNILLWQTDNSMGNAAVMGLIPQVRYILLSDLLLETMTDEQVEAVFAHEVGHIVHRHMAWYVVLIVILMLGMSLAQVMLEPHIPTLPFHINFDIVMNVFSLVVFLLIFGYLSRRFERQADVYAARTIEKQSTPGLKSPSPTPNSPSPPPHSPVGPHGATTFASALYRVAVINNIPIRARNFTHGSIASRMNYLQSISADPERTTQFDRLMFALYAALLFALLLCGGIAWIYRAKLMS